jgi:formylglycine-generating enzyme required for sulfatase activity
MKSHIPFLIEKAIPPFIHYPLANTDEMALIPEGEFLMGTAKGYNADERPKHKVYLDAYYIDKYMVTQKHYRMVMGENPSVWHGSDMPVHMVDWHQAKSFCDKIGKRLPTEAEWEKAAKGGKDHTWAGTSDKDRVGEYAWFGELGAGFADERIKPVGLKKPNGYGIYDMSGNTGEWVSDWYQRDYYSVSPKKNPAGPENGVFRVYRGGDWDRHFPGIRTSLRRAGVPERRKTGTGFRCAKSVT